MEKAICLLSVAGAWSYRVVVTDDFLEDEHGRPALGIVDSSKTMIAIQRRQSAESALATLAHEYVEAWQYHIGHDRETMRAAIMLLAEKDHDLRKAVIENSIESQGTLLVCWLKQCTKVNIQAKLAATFGSVAKGKGNDVAIIIDAARAAITALEAAVAAAKVAELESDRTAPPEPIFEVKGIGAKADVDAAFRIAAEPVVEEDSKDLRYVPDVVECQDWQTGLGQSGGRCECPACGKTINGATVAVGEPKFSMRLRGMVAACMFVCDHCKIGVRWLSAATTVGAFDARSMQDVELLEGRAADDALLEVCGDPLKQRAMPFRYSETG